MEKNNIISDWLDQYGNPEIDKFVETQLNQNKMTNKVESFYQIHQTEGEHTEAIEEFNKVEGSFTTEEQYWACRAGFINGYEIAKKKYESKSE